MYYRFLFSKIIDLFFVVCCVIFLDKYGLEYIGWQIERWMDNLYLIKCDKN